MVNDLRSRIAWAISVVRTDQTIGGKLKDDDLVKLFGVAKNTLLAYEKGMGSLKAVVIDALTNKFNFNLLWIYKGEGEPFPGARNRYPEVCGPGNQSSDLISSFEPPSHPVAILEPSPSYEAQGIDPAIQAMADIRDIFSSNDPILVPAIQANLNAFKRALHRERQFARVIEENALLKDRILKLEKLCAEFKEKLDLLQKEHDTLIEENKTLRSEVNRLKATYENPEGRDGSLTNTAS